MNFFQKIAKGHIRIEPWEPERKVETVGDLEKEHDKPLLPMSDTVHEDATWYTVMFGPDPGTREFTEARDYLIEQLHNGDPEWTERVQTALDEWTRKRQERSP